MAESHFPEENDIGVILERYIDRLNGGEIVHREDVASEHPNLVEEVLV